MNKQQTIAQTVSLSGVGLHSGQPVTLAIHPAPAGTGIIFVRNTQGGQEHCPATIHHLRPINLCTTLGVNGFKIQTVEHVLSALAGLEIDNAFIELDAEEVPAVDGSAAPFVELIHRAGIVSQEAPRTYLKIIHPIKIQKEDRTLTVLPSVLPKVSYSIEYAHPLIQRQTYEFEWTPAEFQRSIASARTFAFSKEVEWLWSVGLGRGGTLDNTLVFSDTDLLNEDGFRFPDECVRHKILDLIGDLSLLGIPVIGHFIADRTGHSAHAEMVKAILDQPSAWILLNAEDEEHPIHCHKISSSSLQHYKKQSQPACPSA